MTTIALSDDIVTELDRLGNGPAGRAKLVETVLRQYLGHVVACDREADDLRIINENADALNKEAEDVLEYQVAL